MNIKTYCRQTNCPLKKQCGRYISDNKYREFKKKYGYRPDYMLPNPDSKDICGSQIIIRRKK